MIFQCVKARRHHISTTTVVFWPRKGVGSLCCKVTDNKDLKNVTTDHCLLYHHRSKRTSSLPTLTLDHHYPSPVSTLIFIIMPVSEPNNGIQFCQQGSTAQTYDLVELRVCPRMDRRVCCDVSVEDLQDLRDKKEVCVLDVLHL